MPNLLTSLEIGSMFIVAGIGNKLAGAWAEQIKRTLNLTKE